MNEAFLIVHPQHGEARCDDTQIAEFQEHGWRRKLDVEAEAKAKADAEAKAKADAEAKANDKDGDGKPDKKSKS